MSISVSISERYRQLADDVRTCSEKIEGTDGERGEEERLVEEAFQLLNELTERVGEIPRIRLEEQLTPVLLKAHICLDGARMIFETQEKDALSDDIWELQQAIYRLLNDL